MCTLDKLFRMRCTAQEAEVAEAVQLGVEREGEHLKSVSGQP
jgi:hypothetical protein